MAEESVFTDNSDYNQTQDDNVRPEISGSTLGVKAAAALTQQVSREVNGQDDAH